ncbi:MULTISPECIES: hypothetical protein [Okeania]|uniref:hypothetical protein n=1 Tax=Okeania TaxID=1458928 RepID=UPI000F53938C|nr:MULTISPECIES: hypothetical protein [Okeania]NET20233.1 hypothetical protein [Okeania sp. SIO1H5]NET95355.1 hypothetical protein [Okeania sp. SIO1H2]
MLKKAKCGPGGKCGNPPLTPPRRGMWEDWDCRRNNFSLIFLPRPAPTSSLYAALFTEKLILFHDLKWLKPLSVNAFIFNQQSNN